MEKKSKIIIYLIVAFIVVILLLSAGKNLNNHYKKEYLVIDNKIKEAAKLCYNEGKCENNITLKDLYDKEYLEVLFDPKSKEKIDDNRCITYKDHEIIFCD